MFAFMLWRRGEGVKQTRLASLHVYTEQYDFSFHHWVGACKSTLNAEMGGDSLIQDWLVLLLVSLTVGG